MTTSEHKLVGEYLRVENETGAGAISTSLSAIRVAQILSVTVKMSAAPTTSENLTITLNSVATGTYDTVLYSVDLAAGSTTSATWMPDQPLWLQPGDSIDVAYTNTDVGTYGVLISMREEL